MKSKITKILLLVIAAVMLFGTVTAYSYESYDTYTYSIDGEPLRSPSAYVAETVVNSKKMGLSTALKAAKDVVADADGNIYIADTGNNRIIVLDGEQYVTTAIISEYVNENNKTETFKAPYGIYVTDPVKMKNGDTERYLYVCDKDNARIVVFNVSDALNGNWEYVRTIDRPQSELLAESAFMPSSIAVDIYGRIFVVSESCNDGVIVLSNAGDFTGFIGAQKVTSSLGSMIWRRFQTDEQKEATTQSTTTAFNNITVDENGFVYVTISFSDPKEQAQQLKSIKSKTSTYSPVKKLNSTGAEIMKRSGFFDPGGEVGVFYASEVSRIVDVAMGNEGAWSILDQSRSRVFTYDQGGNLLYAFGDKGGQQQQLGNGESFVAMCYQVVNGTYKLVLLDNVADMKLTVYSPTEYCDTITGALRSQNNHDYVTSIDFWYDVLTRNNNFDLAYIGIGKALYHQGRYEEAMEMLSFAYETEYYSLAFAEARKEIISKWLIPMIIVIIVLVVLLLKFLGWAKKKNKETSLIVGRKKYWQELIYAFHLIFHPFDGFWDLKHEKRGSVRGGTTILGITVVAFIYQAIGKGYVFQPRDNYDTVILQVAAILVPVGLWVISNWCLTTLFDGEGNLKDVYIATTYSLAPLPFFVILSTILTNVLTKGEGTMVTLLVTIGYVWVAFLLFFGTLVTHDYSLGKNVITILGTIVAMMIIMFVAILFSSLIVKMVSFIISLFTEIGNRA